MAEAGSPVIAAEGLQHFYGSGALRRQILFDVTTRIEAGEIVILTGPSGSGKTTLLTLMGGLRHAQEGSLKVLGQEMRGARRGTLQQLRRGIGFIFQAHNLLAPLTALENVAMGLPGRRMSGKERRERCVEALRAVGLEDRAGHRPRQMSGGQKQRVAVARALVGDPKIVLADEPTASLDKKSGHDVAEMLRGLAKKQGAAVLLVTHDNRILEFADRVLHMEDGRLTSFAGAAFASARQLLASLTNTNRSGDFQRQVLDLPVKQFKELLEQVTGEFQQYLNVLDRTNDAAFSSMLDQVIAAFTYKAGRLLEADRATLFLVDEESRTLYSKVVQEQTEIRVPMGAGIVGRVVETGRTLNIPDAYDEPMFNRDVDARTGYRTRTILCLPVHDSRGRVLGALQALNKAGGQPFDANDETRFREFEAPLGVILETWQRMARGEESAPAGGPTA